MSKIKNIIFYNEDIRPLLKERTLTNDELLIIRHKDWTEHKVQSAAKVMFENLDREMQARKLGEVFFYQIDNGATNSMKRIFKSQEGTVGGMPDGAILLYNNKTKQNKTIFIEFKRVGAKVNIEGNCKTKSGMITYKRYQRQLAVHERLRRMGFSVHLTNNLVYCEKVICKEIKEFIK